MSSWGVRSQQSVFGRGYEYFKKPLTRLRRFQAIGCGRPCREGGRRCFSGRAVVEAVFPGAKRNRMVKRLFPARARKRRAKRKQRESHPHQGPDPGMAAFRRLLLSVAGGPDRRYYSKRQG